MTDDLVKQLRWLGDHASFEPHMHHTAADRIEELEAQISVLFAANVRLNSRADLDSDHYVDRIEKLEAALRWYEFSMCELGDGHGACGKLRDDECSGCRARKALEGKDE